MQTAIQLYTVRDAEKPFDELLADVAATSFDGVEFAYTVADEDYGEVRETMDDLDLAAASAHVGADDLREDQDAVVAAADALGYDDVAVSWLDPEYFESVEAVEETAAMLSELQADLADRGLTMHYHNHDQEFVETDEGVAFHALADSTEDLLFEVDVGWALAGGEDPVDLLHEYADRITHVHVKDVNLDSEEIPALGEGDLDIAAVVDAAEDIDADWLIYENDQPADPSTAHEHGASVFDEYV